MSAPPSLTSLDQPANDADVGGELLADEVSALRLVKVPDWGRPFDGEPTAADTASAAGQFGSAWAWPDPRGADYREVPHVAETDRLETSTEWARQFARILAEALAGVRPVRQILPWTSERARVHVRRLMPLFEGGQRPQVLRVIATRPMREVIEMTVIVAVGARTRALAVRLEQAGPPRLGMLAGRAGHGARAAIPAAGTPGWVCTDVEAA
jgi:hypothetical protein